MVPYLVEICCNIVEEKGLRTKGIYRVPGNSSVTKQLQEEINSRGVECLIDPEDPKFNTELNCVSSLLKHYFRNLLDPLFTNGWFSVDCYIHYSYFLFVLVGFLCRL